jgi:hypothetical protein
LVSEIRHILFRPVEVVEAFKEYCRRSGTSVPMGAVVSAGPESEGPGKPVQFRIVIAPDVPSSRVPVGTANLPNREVIVESPKLTAALILYCRDRRIPLPVAADKSLQRFGEQTCLMATINPKQDKVPALLQL